MTIEHLLAATTLAVFALSSTGQAQEDVRPGTGCPGAAAPIIVSGAPVTGSTLTFTVPPAMPYTSGAFFFVGAASAPITLDPPVACAAGCVALDGGCLYLSLARNVGIVQ